MALRSSSAKFHVLLLVTLALSLCIPSFGQSENATVSGTITDPTGAAVTGAQVKLTNVNTGITAATPSNETGLYVFPVVRPGQYRMVVEKQGFRQIVLTDLTVNVQDALSRNFKLQLGVVGESVTVSGDVNKVNTQDASVSTVVDSQFVENMPLNGRSFQSLIYMTPGVAITPSDIYGLGQFSTNGQRTDTNYFTIDGVSANFGGAPNGGVGSTLGGTSPALTSGGGTNGMVSVDDMQEFRIQTSSYAPEFGRSPGAQIAIATKSGTNRWHGTASEYLRNDVFDARNYFNNAGPSQDIYGNPVPAEAKPPLRQNDFGGTVGGPLWKDRTFFFFSYAGLRLLLQRAGDAPYGVRTSLTAFESALSAFDASATAHGGPSLLVLDPGDAYRAPMRRRSLRTSPCGKTLRCDRPARRHRRARTSAFAPGRHAHHRRRVGAERPGGGRPGLRPAHRVGVGAERLHLTSSSTIARGLLTIPTSPPPRSKRWASPSRSRSSAIRSRATRLRLRRAAHRASLGAQRDGGRGRRSEDNPGLTSTSVASSVCWRWQGCSSWFEIDSRPSRNGCSQLFWPQRRLHFSLSKLLGGSDVHCVTPTLGVAHRGRRRAGCLLPRRLRGIARALAVVRPAHLGRRSRPPCSPSRCWWSTSSSARRCRS